MELIALLIASFANVCLLGLNSQFVRDQRIVLVYFLSWAIHTAQFTYTRIIAITDDPFLAFLVSGFVASTGIVISIHVYRWLLPRLDKWRKK